MTRQRWAVVGLAGVALAALYPLVVGSADGRVDGTQALAYLVAALGLGLALAGGLPSLGQGAFVGLAAYGTALLQSRHGWDPLTAAVAAVAVTAVAGAAVARAVVGLRPAFVALATWLGAWTFALALTAFPAVSGGGQGIALGVARLRLRALGVSVSLTPVVLYEVALVAVAATVLLLVVTRRRWGPALAAVREDPVAAASTGVPVARLRSGAFVGAAVAAGVAGVLLAQATGVADPTAYGPLLSVKLFLVVVVGGATEMVLGPIAGLGALLVVSWLADGLAALVGEEGLRLQPVAVAVLLLLAVLFGGDGLVLRRRRRRRPEVVAENRPDGGVLQQLRGAPLVARGLSVRFGGVQALDGVDLDVGAGACVALVGPNGSGKTTCLRVLAGVVAPDAVTVALDGEDLAGLSVVQRRARGLARTLQRDAVAPALSAVDHVLSGAEPARRAGVLQVLTGTPRSRAEQRAAEVAALDLLDRLALADRATTPAAALDGASHRLLQVGRALAGGARVLLLDEPSSGMRGPEIDQLVAVLAGLRDAGLTLVVVEHDLRVVRALADHVVVLDAGRVLASGPPDTTLADPRVQEAYVGVSS